MKDTLLRSCSTPLCCKKYTNEDVWAIGYMHSSSNNRLHTISNERNKVTKSSYSDNKNTSHIIRGNARKSIYLYPEI